MKPLTAVIHLLLLLTLFSACSKHVTPTPDPVLPPVDSTHLPGDDTGGDGGGGDGGGEIAPVTRTFEFSKVPILDLATRNSIYLGAVVTKTDSKSLLQPDFIPVDASYRKPVYIYTNIPMDDFYLENVIPSKASDNKLLANIQREFEKGVDQVGSISMSSADAFTLRFNDLRGQLGVNKDLNELFDLGFPDTTRLAENKGRVLLYFSVEKADITLQAPIYTPYLTIDSTSQQWETLFGTDHPRVVSSVIYGTTVYLVMESDSSTEQLRLALNRCMQQPMQDLISGIVFSKLALEDRNILSKAKAYGYNLGQGSFPHEGEKAISFFAKAAVDATDPHKLGNPLYFYLNNLIDFKTGKYQIDVTSYPQKIRE